MTNHDTNISRDFLLFTSGFVICIAWILLIAVGMVFAHIGAELALHEGISYGQLQLTALR
jgi:hypothetical protein